MLSAVEFFSGIGGFSEAAKDRIEIVGAFEISPHCVQVYNERFPHRSTQADLIKSNIDIPLADLWWISAPCTPFTRRGPQRDLSDHRAEPFVAMMQRLQTHQPKFVCMENVEAFVGSDAHKLFHDTAAELYDVYERVVCPTEFGIPNKRPRYYAVASQKPLSTFPLAEDGRTFDMNELLSCEPGPVVAERIVEKYGRVMHSVNGESPYTTCFTGGYAKSWVYAGSYVESEEGPRLFSPKQIEFALGFTPIEWPDAFSERQKYKYLGNSLSVYVVERILDGLLKALG